MWNRGLVGRLGGAVAACALALAAAESGASDLGDGDARVRVVVVDPGHGGADLGGRGASGAPEKDIALQISRRIGEALEEAGLRVIYTRETDEFVSLAERTRIANKAGADLFLSVHANAAPNPKASGQETYFLSLDASDEEARRVAMAENAVFDLEGTAPGSGDVVGNILGDMLRTRHLRDSSAIAAAIQRRLGPLPGPSRGVKQAPFAVLMGVNMPAALLEVGFVTNAREERRLGTLEHQQRIARAVAEAVRSYRNPGDGPAAGEE